MNMKWDFFYDPGDEKKYRTKKDWFNDIKYLIRPSIILFIVIVLMVIGLLVYLEYFMD